MTEGVEALGAGGELWDARVTSVERGHVLEYIAQRRAAVGDTRFSNGSRNSNSSSAAGADNGSSSARGGSWSSERARQFTVVDVGGAMGGWSFHVLDAMVLRRLAVALGFLETHTYPFPSFSHSFTRRRGL